MPFSSRVVAPRPQRQRLVARASGKTLFRLVVSGVDLRNADEAAIADALVLPCSQGMEFARWRREISPDAWRQVAHRRIPVIFDASGEGTRFDSRTFEPLHAFLAERGVAVSRCTYITQHRLFEPAYAAYWPVAAERMKVMHYDYFIRRFFSFGTLNMERVFKRRLARFQAREKVRPHRFISLNGTLRASKLVFLLKALDDGFLEKGLVSIGDFQNAAARLEGASGGPFRHWARYHSDRLPDLAAYSGMFLGEGLIRQDDGKETPPFGNAEMPEHDQSWFTVVTETEMTSDPIRITEKAMKPLVNFHPFLMLGNPGSLDFIRDLGFETFSDQLDERYDLEPDPVNRFKLFYRQFAKLCRTDEADLARREAKLSERLIHNARWGLTKLPAELERRDEAFLAELFSVSGNVGTSLPR